MLTIAKKLVKFSFLCLFLLTPLQALAQIEQKSSLEPELINALLDFHIYENTPYAFTTKDLNSDGVEEVLVLLYGSHWCGSGGCTLLVLTKVEESWKVDSKVPTVNTPVKLTTYQSENWFDLSVIESGGGNLNRFFVRLSRKNNTYVKSEGLSRKKFDESELVFELKPKIHMLKAQ